MIFMPFLLLLAQSLWFVWPAYTANAFPAVLNGKMPLDFGRKLGKNRLLGGSKTIEGTLGGILFGIFIGLIQMNIYSYFPASVGLKQFTFELIILLSVGALAGDLIGSFIKRRLGIKPGQSAVLLDQLDFLVFALLFASFVFVPSLDMVVLLIIITPVIHLLTNVVGYSLKLKKQPW